MKWAAPEFTTFVAAAQPPLFLDNLRYAVMVMPGQPIEPIPHTKADTPLKKHPSDARKNSPRVPPITSLLVGSPGRIVPL
jgi:hypothetical protein